MSDPTYLAQIEEPATVAERDEWLKARTREAEASGCRHTRASLHRDYGILLLEGWPERPEVEGTPRWQLTKVGQ